MASASGAHIATEPVSACVPRSASPGSGNATPVIAMSKHSAGAAGCSGANSTERVFGSRLRPMVATEVPTEGGWEDSALANESLHTEYWLVLCRGSLDHDDPSRRPPRVPRD